MLAVWLLLAFIAGGVTVVGVIVYSDYRKWAGKSLREFPKRQ